MVTNGDPDVTDRGMPPSPETRRGPPLGAVIAIAGACLLMALMSAADTRFVTMHHDQAVPWDTILAGTAPRWILFAFALPLVLHVTLRRPPWPFALGTFALHVMLFVALATAHAIIHGWAGLSLLPFGTMFGFQPHVIRIWLNSTPLIVPLYCATLLTAWSIQQARERRARALRESQLENQLQAARLAALKAQLHPHFLYNTLNGISALVADRQNGAASVALEQLAELLHAAFRDDGRDLIPLHEEVVLAERYLALQQLRFRDRLRYDVAVASDASTCAVPPLILQPLVENAVVHGLARRSGAMRLTLDARRDGGYVTVVVAHDGAELPADWTPSSRGGVGLRNTRARLMSAFGDAAELRVQRRAGGGVESVMRVPAGASPDTPRDATPRATPNELQTV